MPPPNANYILTYSWSYGKSQEVRKIEKKKMGRPTDAPKTYRESFRLSEDCMKKIKFCMERTGKSKTDIIRWGIDSVYNELKK